MSMSARPTTTSEYSRFCKYLKNGQTDEFSSELIVLAEQSPEEFSKIFTVSENGDTLLTLAIRNDNTEAIEKMIDLGADVNFCTYSNAPARCASVLGHWKSLTLLLHSSTFMVNAVPLLPIIVKNLEQQSTEKSDFLKCFNLLLNDPRIDINQLDEHKCPALYYAAQHNNSKIVLELLKRGARITMKNRFNKLAIIKINSKILEMHFDTCITMDGLYTSNTTIRFNYENLLPAPDAPDSTSMTSIKLMSKSKQFKQLVTHPLITSLISLKWTNWSFFFRLNVFVCAFFAYITLIYNSVCNEAFKLGRNCKTENQNDLKEMTVIVLVLTIYLAVREMLQLIHSPRVYLKTWSNYLECTLIVLVMLSSFSKRSQKSEEFIRVIILSLATIEVIFAVQLMPLWSFPTYFIILKTYTKTFLKILLLSCIILLTLLFALLLLIDPIYKLAIGSEMANNTVAMVDTVLAVFGEEERMNKWFSNKLSPPAHLVVGMFILFAFTMLNNLLNALAVIDAQTVRTNAELMTLINRAQALANIEDVFVLIRSLINKIFCRSAEDKSQKHIFEIRVKPHDGNKMLINTNPNLLRSRKNCCFLNRFVCMESDIMNMAFQVLDKRAVKQIDKNDGDVMKHRVDEIVCVLYELRNRNADMENTLQYLVHDLKN